jgi:hypothetical protein
MRLQRNIGGLAGSNAVQSKYPPAKPEALGLCGPSKRPDRNAVDSAPPPSVRKHPSPFHPLPLFPLPGEREEGEGSWGEGTLSKLWRPGK